MKKKLGTFLRWVPLIATGIVVVITMTSPTWAHETHNAQVRHLVIICIVGFVADLIVIGATRPLMSQKPALRPSRYSNRTRRDRRTRRA